MKIEAVIVCKDYADFLEHTLPENMQHLDRCVVVTHPGDKATIDLCRKFGVECVKTECMHEDGDAFNKGRAINLGLGHFRGHEWFLHLDADIRLPHNFRNLLHRAKLRKENVYGADRLNVYGFDHWIAHKEKTVPAFSGRYFVEAVREFPLGARIIHDEHGYCPIGYFQLWHQSQGKKYPINQGNAEHTDLLFACQWPRHQRVLLPEVLVYHLESGDGPIAMGVNWNGRKTPPFKSSHHHHRRRHHCHCHPQPYCPKASS